MASETASASRFRTRRVRIMYKGSFSDGSVFYDNTGGQALEVMLGIRALPDALDAAIAEMAVGEERTIVTPKAYGDRDPGALQRRIPRFEIPQGDQLHEGMTVMWFSPVNRLVPIPAKVIRADEFTVDLDFNHPLAGMDLVYWVKLVELVD